ncbi:MAG: hypothetical protein K9J81_07425 [Desulfohalobiaceae bacterium]|nr:hypothetical protein [Desulfohalobiaceae bacterium]
MTKPKTLIQRFIQGMEPWVFLPAALLVILFVASSGGFTDLAQKLFEMLQGGIIEYFR